MNIDFSNYIDLDSFSDEQKAQIVNSLVNLVLVRIADMIGDYLSDQELAELEQAGNSSDPRAVMNWLETHVPNFDQGVEEILQEESVLLKQQISALTDYAITSNQSIIQVA